MTTSSQPSSQVSVGLATQLGLIGTIAGGVTTVVQSLEHNQALLTGAGKPAGIAAFAVLGLTILGRMFQAAHLTKAAAVVGAVQKDAEKLPSALAALAAEAQANVTKVEASPDHVQTDAVAYAEPSREGGVAPSQG